MKNYSTISADGFEMSFIPEPELKILSFKFCPEAGNKIPKGNSPALKVFRQALTFFNEGRGHLPVEHLEMGDLSDFQRLILLALYHHVPRGKVTSYGTLARMAGFPGAARAAGSAMHNNPFPLFVPCHRVIKSDGQLGGFGPGAAIKRELLKREGVKFITENRIAPECIIV